MFTEIKNLQDAIAQQGQKLDDALLHCAEDYLARGTTLYEESIASGSTIGPAKVTEQDPRILDWIYQLQALRLEDSGSLGSSNFDATASERAVSVYTSGTSFTSGTSVPGGIRLFDREYVDRDESKETGNDDNPELDFEDELAIELADAAVDAGRSAYDARNYAETETMFKERLKLAQAVSSHHRKAFDLHEMHYRLAICAYFLYDDATAEAALTSFIEQPTSTEQERLCQCHASHLLSQSYVKMQKFDQARLACDNSYRGRRKLLGKDSEICFESLALLSMICDMQRNTALAKAYRTLIPPAHLSSPNVRLFWRLRPSRTSKGARERALRQVRKSRKKNRHIISWPLSAGAQYLAKQQLEWSGQ